VSDWQINNHTGVKMSDYKNIIVKQENKAGVIQINRPDAMNALNSQTMAEMLDALQSFDTNNSVGCTIITGSQKVFSAGADIKQMANASPVDMLNMNFIEYYKS